MLLAIYGFNYEVHAIQFIEHVCHLRKGATCIVIGPVPQLLVNHKIRLRKLYTDTAQEEVNGK